MNVLSLTYFDKLNPIFGSSHTWLSELIRSWNDFGDGNEEHLMGLADNISTLETHSYRVSQYIRKYIYLFVKYLLQYGDKFYGPNLASIYIYIYNSNFHVHIADHINSFCAIEYEQLYGVRAETQFIILWTIAYSLHMNECGLLLSDAQIQ